MADLGFDPLAAIADHSRALAAAAEGHLPEPVPSCPGWSIADLVAHVTEVQWFWATIVEDQLTEPADEDRRPQRAPDERLTASLRRQTDRLVRVLGEAEPSRHVWTWAPAQQDAAFVTRHQVQEAAVHHWDAAAARGRPIAIEAPVAIDSISEFLTFSVSSDADLAEPSRPPLDGRFVLQCIDANQAWTVADGLAPGAVAWEAGAATGVAAVAGTASDLLLWLYRRIQLPPGEVPEPLLARFSALCFTD